MQIVKKNINKIIPFLIIGLLLSDFITSVVYKLSLFSFYRFSGFFKMFFEIVMLSVIIFNFKSITKLHKVLLGFIVVFFISQLLSFQSSYDFIYHISRGNIYFFNRYIYILLFLVFISTINIPKFSYLKTYNYFEVLLFINCLMMLIGFFFEVNIFKSYESTPRFGFTGLFSKPEEAGYIYCIAIIYNYYNWVIKKHRTNLVKAIIFILTILMLGQKKMLLFLALLIVMHLLFQVKHKKVFRVLIPTLTVIVIAFYNKIITYLISFSPFWKNIYNEKGILSMLTSTRSDLLNDSINYIRGKWNFANYIFGGIDFNKHKVEFEAVDLYLFLGIFGLLFYVYLINYHFFKNSDSLKKSLIFILFITSFFGGGLLLSVTATLLLYIVINKVMVTNNYA